MDQLQMGFEIAKIAVTVFGAVFVVWYWNREKHRLDQYRYLDETYGEILKSYSDQPQFGQPDLTSAYREAFKGADLWKYHYFSMRVHSFLESIFDVSKGKIPDVWAHVFRYHAHLHSAWLRDHRELHEPEYIRSVLSDKTSIPRSRERRRTPNLRTRASR